MQVLKSLFFIYTFDQITYNGFQYKELAWISNLGIPRSQDSWEFPDPKNSWKGIEFLSETQIF